MRDRHNSLAINTTTCDLLGLDIDVQDFGLESWEALQRAHGNEDAPTVRTGSGGLHLYYSHSKSIAAGLCESTPTHFVKLYLEQEDGAMSKLGIDMRGKGRSSCLIAPGSSYLDGTGERVGYELINRSTLPPVTDLPPLPSWLIDILNRRASLEARWKEQERQKEGKARAASVGVGGPSQPADASSEPDLASRELQGEVGDRAGDSAVNLGRQHLGFQRCEAVFHRGSGCVQLQEWARGAHGVPLLCRAEWGCSRQQQLCATAAGG